MARPKKMPLASMDIAEQKRRRLEALVRGLKKEFPEVMNESRVDIDALRQVLGEEALRDSDTRFGLNWAGKAECMKIILQQSRATLLPARDESVNFDETENLFIEGDNLEVLKLLQKSYYEKVKMIYIDPPYNTGKEFIYPDKFAETLETYLEYTGQKDSEGRKFSTNAETDGRFHSRWLNMMYPRLYLARNLLRENGMVFISIDDNEQAHLKALCDIVFGEENFVVNAIWEKVKIRKNSAKWFSDSHDHILIYCKDKEQAGRNLLPRKDTDNYKNPDNDPRGDWIPIPIHANHQYNADYKIRKPNGVVLGRPKNNYWRLSEKSFHQHVKENRIWWGKGKSYPMIKRFLSEVKSGLIPKSIFYYDEVGGNPKGDKDLKDLFNQIKLFENPKSTNLVSTFCQIATNAEDIVLDFFAGSATTAHAVMQLNAEDGGSRKFICVQLPEPCDEKSEAHKAGYKTIADIGKERIRRAAQKIAQQRESGLDLRGGGKPDLGFKVLKLSPSNFEEWRDDSEKMAKFKKQLKMHISHIAAAATREGILHELLLDAGFSLTAPLQKIKMAGKEVFSIENGVLLICLEEKITQAAIDAMAAARPRQVICLDAGFQNNDQLKTNAVQTFKDLARKQESEAVFRTV